MINELLGRVGAAWLSIESFNDTHVVLSRSAEKDGDHRNRYLITDQSLYALCQMVACKSQGGRFVVIGEVKGCPGCELSECAKCPARNHG